MAEFPAMPLWTDAYLGDTTHLDTLEHGAYLLLLIAMWRSGECRLPSEDAMLIRYSGLDPRQWRRMKPIILRFFVQDGGYITQLRLQDEWDFVRRLSERQSDKARSRWLKTKGSDHAPALPRQCRTDAPTPTPTPNKNIVRLEHPDFYAFYAAYPKRRSRKTAAKAYARARADGVSHETIMDGLAKALQSDSRFRDIQFTPLPASWLNAGGWGDESEIRSTKSMGIV